VRQDETGFAEFYRASHQRCLRAVIAGAGRPDLAEDLVAEAFTRALVSWRTVRDHPAPEAWVVRTAPRGASPSGSPRSVRPMGT
jgi:DNA-directed RNA polymerase specialized sigma24 family protein